MVRHFGRHAPACRMMLFGTGGRTRTGTLFTAGDFEFTLYTHFSTLNNVPRSRLKLSMLLI